MIRTLFLSALPALALLLPAHAAEPSPSPTMNSTPQEIRSAYLGGGCFWCVEAEFQTVPGVKAVVSGYAGGTKENPTYEEVCTGRTGHAEVVRIDYDPAVVGYGKLIDLFWNAHDPTTLNRQGADTGTQYRSIILTTTAEEKAAAEKSKASAQTNFKSPIVTEIVPLVKFYPAEAYHQDYYERNPGNPYNQAVVRPKLEKFKSHTE